MVVNMLGEFLRALRDLPLNVVVIASWRYRQDEMGREKYTPELTGQLREAVQGFFDLVGALITSQAADSKTGQIPRRLQLELTSKYCAKSRRSIFRGSHIDDPTMTSIMEAIGMSSAEK